MLPSMSVRASTSSFSSAELNLRRTLRCAIVVGSLAATGCVIGPEGWTGGANSMDDLTCVHDRPCACQHGCQHPGESCGDVCIDEGDSCQTQWNGPTHSPRLAFLIDRVRARCHWYEPEAGIFNFCVPPASLGELPPPPPGRFFPVPARPVFAPQGADVVAVGPQS
jgi:hypothetical protein